MAIAVLSLRLLPPLFGLRKKEMSEKYARVNEHADEQM